MYRILYPLLAAALVAAFLWPASASAYCLSPKEAIRATQAMYPGSEVITHLRGAEGRTFMAFFNALPPGTSYAGDEIIGFYHPRYHLKDEPVILFLVFADGCRVGRILMAPLVFRQFRPDFALPGEAPA